MAGRTKIKAVQNFLRQLRKAVSCITKTYLNYSPPKNSDGIYALLLGDGTPVKLTAQDGKVFHFTCLMHFRVVPAQGDRGPWKVQTASWLYRIEDENQQEIVSYHWQPGTQATVWFPHVHVRGNWKKVHFPTGRVSVENMIRLLIEEFRVKPAKSGWEDVLRETQKKHERYRTWA